MIPMRLSHSKRRHGANGTDVAPNSGYEINRADENLPSSGRSYHCHCRQSDEQDSLELNEDGVLLE
jgi:hypothetical protein